QQSFQQMHGLDRGLAALDRELPRPLDRFLRLDRQFVESYGHRSPRMAPAPQWWARRGRAALRNFTALRADSPPRLPGSGDETAARAAASPPDPLQFTATLIARGLASSRRGSVRLRTPSASLASIPDGFTASGKRNTRLKLP